MQPGPPNFAAYPAPPRPPQPAPAVPRSGLLGWGAAYLIAFLVAWAAPYPIILFQLHGRTADFWALFRTGASLFLSVQGAMMATLASLSMAYILGRRIPGWLLFGIALVPSLIGFASAFRGHDKLLRALQDVDPGSSMVARIFSAGSGEAEAPIVFGSTITASMLTLVAIAALVRVLTIDRRDLDPGKKTRAGTAMGIAAGVAVFGLLVAFGLRIALRELSTAPALLLLGFTISAAILAAWRAPLAAMLDRDPRAEAGDVVRSYLLMAVASAAAALFLASAGCSLARSETLRFIAGESVDASQRTHLLAAMLSTVGACRTLGIVDALLLFGALLVPVIFSGVARRGLAPRLSLIAWVIALSLPLGASIAHGNVFTKDLLAYGRPRALDAIPGLSVPVTNLLREDAEGFPRLYVTREGRLLLDTTEGQKPPVVADTGALQEAFAPRGGKARALLLVDAATTYATLQGALAPVLEKTKALSSKHFGGFRLVVAPHAPAPPMGRPLPAQWAGLAGDEYRAVNFDVDGEGSWELIIVLDGAKSYAMREDGKGRRSISLGDAENDAHERASAFKELASGKPPTHVTILPRASDDLALVFRILQSVPADKRDFAFSLGMESERLARAQRPYREKDEDDSIAESIASNTPFSVRSQDVVLHTGNIATDGPIPAETIQRITRGAYPRFRVCYEKALAENPTAAGKVLVKFMILGNGSVRIVETESPEAMSQNAVACITRGFTSLTFPQPGSNEPVPVIYPLLFSTSK